MTLRLIQPIAKFRVLTQATFQYAGLMLRMEEVIVNEKSCCF